MAAARCSDCGISYPLSMSRCHVCDGILSGIANDSPDEDWREAVERANAEPVFRRNEADRIEAWRLQQLLEAGYAVDEATEISKRWQGIDAIDLHQAVELVAARGCPHDLAALIVL